MSAGGLLSMDSEPDRSLPSTPRTMHPLGSAVLDCNIGKNIRGSQKQNSGLRMVYSRKFLNYTNLLIEFVINDIQTRMYEQLQLYTLDGLTVARFDQDGCVLKLIRSLKREHLSKTTANLGINNRHTDSHDKSIHADMKPDGINILGHCTEFWMIEILVKIILNNCSE